MLVCHAEVLRSIPIPHICIAYTYFSREFGNLWFFMCVSDTRDAGFWGYEWVRLIFIYYYW